MISRQKLKLIKSLQLKKYQKQEQKFLVEGEKSVFELLNSRYKINLLLATKRFLSLYQYMFREKYFEIVEVTEQDLSRAGFLKTNNTAIAVVDMPEYEDPDLSDVRVLPVFENLQDPGNLGTIIRTCDWYGLDTIILSDDSVDVYNPKVIQASMGSFTRVKVYYQDLLEFIGKTKIPVYGTKTDGENIHEVDWPGKVIVLFGNESRGINKRLDPFISKVISIPKFGGAESLNVGIAVAIVLDNLRRQGL